MSSNIRQAVATTLKALVLLLAVVLFCSTARAQMNDSGGGALGGGAGGYDSSGADSDSQNGAVGNTMRRGCVDPSDPNADESGLPPCTNSDNSDDSDQSSQGNPSTLSGGVSGMTGSPRMSGSSTMSGSSAMSGAQGLGGAQGFANTMNKQSMAAVIQQLGISPDELGSLKGEMASGGLSPDDMQELCLHFAAKQLSANDVTGIAKSLGLTFTDQQLAQLRSCTGLAGQGGSDETTTSPGQQMGMTPQQSMSPANSNQPASSVESQFRALDSAIAPAAPSTRNLQQFGYSLFASRVSTFAPVANVPVSDDYVIGPGDQLKMLMWGRINNTINLTVGRDGAVSIPEIGPLQVAGLNFAQTKKLIEDHAGQITGVKVDVTMGKLKTIQVYVVGEVSQPGAYTVSALSHVSNALGAAGGITKIGSLRKVELRRGNQLVRVIDLYSLLLAGNEQGDEQLQPGDVIFVPVIGPVVGMVGDVKRPAIYELGRSGEPLDSVIKLGGGISAFGYSQRVQVERVDAHQKRIALDVDLNQIRSQRFDIRDGDLIKIYPVLPTQQDIVTVRGSVNRPGKFEWHQGMRVADLVQLAEGPAPHTFFKYALIRRKEGKAKTVRLVPVDLGEAMSDIVGGPQNISLEQEDELTVFSESQMKYLPTVQAFGEVRNPGYYVMSQGMHVSDLIYLAGGLKDDAYQKNAEIARTQVINGSHTSHTFMDVDLRAALSGNDEHNPELVANDQLFVRRASDWHLPWVVMVKGMVQRPGPYTIHDGERMASVLERSGGLLPDAYLPATVLIRQSIKELQQKRLDEARARLQQSIVRIQMNPGTMNQLAATQNPQSQNPATSPQTLAALQQVLTETEGQQAQGRLVIHMHPLNELANSPDNVVLVDQDQVTIPRRPDAVNVLGQVYSPNAIVFRPGLTTRDYLNQAGGPNEGADPDHIMVIKADGSVMTDEGIKSSKESTMFPLLPVISGGLMSARLDPGDTVYVPEKLIYENKMQETATITQIIANAASSLAVIGILGASL
ncbi:SLBB domain-containing protein [Candidatus Binatus sp.]|uniref:SLBB domain-containing protein n=1 Tax=Candidatus Binatus sp. TaxID=2811406 RepID=UPI003CC6C223